MQKLLSRTLVLAVFLTPLPLLSQTASPTPLVTQSATTIGDGAMEFSLSASYADGITPQPLLGENDGSLLQGPILRFGYGLGRHGELTIEWPAYQSFDADLGDTDSDVGDLHIWTKLGFRQQADKGPAIGFRFGVKVPNTSEEHGLGTDETDVFGSLLLQQKMFTSSAQRDGLILFNLGIAILGDPLASGEQEDAITYGVGFEFPIEERHAILLEAAGSLDDSTRRETGDQGEARFGYRYDASRGSFHTALRVGYTDVSPDWGLVAGYTWRFPSDG